MSLIVELRINQKPIGAVIITRTAGDTEPDTINTYRWRYTPDYQHEATGTITHRYGDGAIALTHAVLGEITERHQIAAGYEYHRPDTDPPADTNTDRTAQ